MSSNETYTYRGGRKVVLTKRPDQFVVRAQPEALAILGIADAERVSPSSVRVTTRAEELEPMMARSRTVAPTHHSYRRAATDEEFLITDRVFVHFKEPLAADAVARFAGQYGLRHIRRTADRDHLFQLTEHTGINPVKLVVKLSEEDATVALAEHDLNHRLRRMAFSPPTDPAYARQWHLHRRFANPDVDTRSSSRCEEAWRLLDGFGSADVVVGVTDDGCKLDHPDFNSPGKFAGWGYFVGSRLVRHNDADAVPGRMFVPDADHGTNCAGVIAGEADATLTVGAAPGCRLLPIRWEMNGPYLQISDSKLVTALDFVADKVDVLSNSWGSAPTSSWAAAVITRIRDLARTGGRRGRGIVFLWAAGNENCPIDHVATIDVPYDNGWDFVSGAWRWVGVSTSRQFENNLVGVDGVMHIAALASPARRSHYSNHGTGLALCAPTSNGHEYWRLEVPGLGVTTTTGDGAAGVTDEFGGTSSATPLVAGVAALVISADPNLSALAVISILKRTAAKDLDFAGYPRTPPASFDPSPTWDVSPIAPFDRGDFQDIGHADGTWSPWFGHGRVDAEKAVAAALATGPGPVPGGEHVSAPNLAIPDNNSTGVRDTLRVADTGRLVSVRATVEIMHTFIGDLRVTLAAPSGKAVVLHDRAGGSTHNLLRRFDVDTTPALRTLAGEEVKGDWTLTVQDVAVADSGRLTRWALELGVQASDVVEGVDAPGSSIPDKTPAGIERTIDIAVAGVLGDVDVSVDITHTYIGDLQVTLVAPSGRSVVLHNRAGGGSDNLLATWKSTSVAALQVLRGESIKGAWRLKVADLDAIDTGKLNRWSLRLVRQGPLPSSVTTAGAGKATERSKVIRPSAPAAPPTPPAAPTRGTRARKGR